MEPTADQLKARVLVRADAIRGSMHPVALEKAAEEIMPDHWEWRIVFVDAYRAKFMVGRDRRVKLD